MKIYTKRGDKGITSLYDSSKVSKSHILIETLGAVDELNCELGMIFACSSHIKNDIVELAYLQNIQHLLFTMGSIIAMPKKKDLTEIVLDKDGIVINQLEEYIDIMTDKLPKLRNFILPGSGYRKAEYEDERYNMILVAAIHRARAVCRRTECKLTTTALTSKSIELNCLKIINRLSDYLFTLARYICWFTHLDELTHI